MGRVKHDIGSYGICDLANIPHGVFKKVKAAANSDQFWVFSARKAF